jgi:hypothetical protein
MWKCYELRYRAKSPLHIGYGSQLGIVNRTRYYIPGKTMWGAVTAVLSRKIMGSYDVEIYKKIGDFVQNHLIFGYFYPVKGGDDLYPNYTEKGFGFGSKGKGEFVMDKEEFEKEFISSYVSTGLDKTSRTAEEGSLHEFELISQKVKEEEVCFTGHVFVKEGGINFGKNKKYIFVKNVGKETIIDMGSDNTSLFEAITSIQVGGERNYGFGWLSLNEQPVETDEIFGKYKIELNSDYPRVEVKKEMVALSHVLMDGNERIEWIKGDIEPLVGREWDNEKGKGAGQKISDGDVKICLTPGTRFSLKKGKEIKVGEFGVWGFFDVNRRFIKE